MKRTSTSEGSSPHNDVYDRSSLNFLKRLIGAVFPALACDVVSVRLGSVPGGTRLNVDDLRALNTQKGFRRPDVAVENQPLPFFLPKNLTLKLEGLLPYCYAEQELSAPPFLCLAARQQQQQQAMQPIIDNTITLPTAIRT
jgi:hypothetical protein